MLLKQLRNRNGHKELSRFQPILFAIKPGLWKACLERVCCLLPTSIPTNSITRPTGKEACHCLTLRGATFSLSSSQPISLQGNLRYSREKCDPNRPIELKGFLHLCFSSWCKDQAQEMGSGRWHLKLSKNWAGWSLLESGVWDRRRSTLKQSLHRCAVYHYGTSTGYHYPERLWEYNMEGTSVCVTCRPESSAGDKYTGFHVQGTPWLGLWETLSLNPSTYFFVHVHVRVCISLSVCLCYQGLNTWPYTYYASTLPLSYISSPSLILTLRGDLAAFL